MTLLIRVLHIRQGVCTVYSKVQLFFTIPVQQQKQRGSHTLPHQAGINSIRTPTLILRCVICFSTCSREIFQFFHVILLCRKRSEDGEQQNDAGEAEQRAEGQAGGGRKQQQSQGQGCHRYASLLLLVS